MLSASEGRLFWNKSSLLEAYLLGAPMSRTLVRWAGVTLYAYEDTVADRYTGEIFVYYGLTKSTTEKDMRVTPYPPRIMEGSGWKRTCRLELSLFGSAYE